MLEESDGVSYRMMAETDAPYVIPAVSKAFDEGEYLATGPISILIHSNAFLTGPQQNLHLHHAAGEPTTKAGGSTLADMTAFCTMFIPRMHEMSVLATDSRDGSVVGAFLCQDYR